MQRTMLIAAAFAVLSTASSADACENCKLKDSGYYIGETTLLGNGTVRSWARLAKDGAPISLGVTFSENSLSGLPADLPADTKMRSYEYRLELPKEAVGKTVFDHIGVDWNPKGHIPPKIYDVPHFDFHFYMISQDDRSKIVLDRSDLSKFQKKPDAKFMPEGYIYAPESEEPTMGAHWVDLATPELNGQPFTYTLIWGSYNGSVTFIEPMVTVAHLMKKEKVSIPIKMPAAFQKRGYYPTKYTIEYDPNRQEYTVAYEGFVKK